MNSVFRQTRVAAAIAGVVVALGAGHAQGAAFALQETSGSALGNAFAAGAAAAEDASSVYTNPASMARFATPQVAAAVHLITPSIKFSDSGSAAAAFQPLGHSGGDAGSLNVVPTLFAMLPVNRAWSVGLAVNAPFGLVTDYGDGWAGRFQAIKSDVKTINVNPSVSWRVSDRVAFGVGADFQRVKATFTNRVNYSGALAQAAQQAAAGGLIPAAAVPPFVASTAGLETGANITGDDSAWGWNAGVMFDLDSMSRVGAQYRSGIKYNVAGNVSFDNPTLPALPPTLAPVGAAISTAVNGVLAGGGVSANIELPEIANISYFRRLNDRWDIMADAQWTGWSSLKDLTFVRTTGVVLASTPENFKDVWRLSGGANYRYNDRLMFRGGIAWDQSPVNNVDRTPRLPDADRWWFSAGASYRVDQHLKLDVGVTYITADNASINQNAGNAAASGLLSGNYDAHVTIVSGQVSYSF